MGTSQFNKLKNPHLFAHRGGNAAGGKKENSKRAFNSAVRMGYKFLETDVILTKDGQVICYHGSHNWYSKRKSGLELRRRLQKLTYEQIIELDLMEGEKVSTLEEILIAFPSSCFSIDVKTRQVITPAVEAIKRAKAENRIIITSFSLFRTLKANRLLRGKDKLDASLCLSRVSAKIVSPVNSIFIRLVKLLGVKYLQVSYTRISKRLVRLAHKNGIFIYAWTVNDQKNIRKLLSMHVDGIMSDESKLLLKVAKTTKA